MRKACAILRAELLRIGTQFVGEGIVYRRIIGCDCIRASVGWENGTAAVRYVGMERHSSYRIGIKRAVDCGTWVEGGPLDQVPDPLTEILKEGYRDCLFDAEEMPSMVFQHAFAFFGELVSTASQPRYACTHLTGHIHARRLYGW